MHLHAEYVVALNLARIVDRIANYLHNIHNIHKYLIAFEVDIHQRVFNNRCSRACASASCLAILGASGSGAIFWLYLMDRKVDFASD